MARTKLSDELKEAISQLSDKEKDKLLYRLVAKDGILAEQLYYQLIEGGEDPAFRREDLLRELEEELDTTARHFQSPGFLLLNLRDISGQINRHVRITKDRYGEVLLNLYMINGTFERLGPDLTTFDARKSRSLDNYLVKRAIKLLKLIKRLHEDLWLDFQDDFRLLGENIQQQETTARMAEVLGLDLRWLKQMDPPEYM